jgi:nitroreductase
METLAAIAGRRATRAYTKESVDRDTIERLIEIAVQAPSSVNKQPWAFAVYDGADRLRSFSDEAKRVVLGGGHLDSSPDLRDMLRSADFNIFYGAPTLIVICATSAESQAAEDCALAAQNLMLAAFDAGLATCPIGFARPWLNLPETKRKLGIAQDHHPAFALVLGHAAEKPEDHGRRKPDVLWG